MKAGMDYDENDIWNPHYNAYHQHSHFDNTYGYDYHSMNESGFPNVVPKLGNDHSQKKAMLGFTGTRMGGFGKSRKFFPTDYTLQEWDKGGDEDHTHRGGIAGLGKSELSMSPDHSEDFQYMVGTPISRGDHQGSLHLSDLASARSNATR